MRRSLLLAIATFMFIACARTPKELIADVGYTPTPNDVSIVYTDAFNLTITGKLMTDTPNPFHRVDTVEFKGFTVAENRQVRMSSGLAVAFKTNSGVITVRPKYGYYQKRSDNNTISAWGYNLYIKQDDEWFYASSVTSSEANLDKELTIIKNMDSEEKECLLYLPLFAELQSLEIGVEEGAEIEAIPNPFRYRIGVFGSSFTHGAGTSRSGMAYPAQLSRMTGLQFLSLGCSGNCKMQPYFADVLCAADVDAFVFDCFSNPTVAEMEKRLFPFIEKLQTAHPGVPLIFQRTIYREGRNFSHERADAEEDKIAVSDSLMAIACEKYPDVYYIYPDATDQKHETSVDGIHPGDYGYTLWAESVRKPILKILKKYGIR